MPCCMRWACPPTHRTCTQWGWCRWPAPHLPVPGRWPPGRRRRWAAPSALLRAGAAWHAQTLPRAGLACTEKDGVSGADGCVWRPELLASGAVPRRRKVLHPHQPDSEDGLGGSQPAGPAADDRHIQLTGLHKAHRRQHDCRGGMREEPAGPDTQCKASEGRWRSHCGPSGAGCPAFSCRLRHGMPALWRQWCRDKLACWAAASAAALTAPGAAVVGGTACIEEPARSCLGLGQLGGGSKKLSVGSWKLQKGPPNYEVPAPPADGAVVPAQSGPTGSMGHVLLLFSAHFDEISGRKQE